MLKAEILAEKTDALLSCGSFAARTGSSRVVVTPDGDLHAHLLTLQQHAAGGCQASVKLHTVQTSWQVRSRVMTDLHDVQVC